MNDFMKTEILNMKLMVNSFQQRIEYAAFQDDERISDEERKTMKRINKAVSRFLKDLDRLS